MTRATLRVRMGVIAASAITAFALCTTSAHAAVSVNSTEISGSATAAAHTHAHPVTFGPVKESRAQRLTQRHTLLVHRVLSEARRQKGKPYIYGDAGPHGFDCSGLVRFVFEHAVHKDLPHNAAEQYSVLHHIRRGELQKGDLIFTDNGYISHVGIFAGHGHWWVAPHTGTRVQLQQIYSAHFVYARVLTRHLR